MEVKRIPPCPDYDIRGTEYWLEEMAAKGFRLCQGYAFQYGFAYFIKEAPRVIRYRLVPAENVGNSLATPSATLKEPSEETLKFHADFGWHYVTARGQFWIFCCEDPNAPELNTDPRVQAIALKTVEKRLVRHLFWLILYGLVMNVGHKMPFFTTLLWAGWYAHVPKMFFVVCALIAWVPGIIHIIRFRKKLNEGVFPEHTRHFPIVKNFVMQILRCSFVVVFFLMVVLMMPDYTKYGNDLSVNQAAELEYVTIADLFPEAEVRYISSSNFIYEWSTDAAPECLKMQEHFRLTFPDGTSVSGVWNLLRFHTDADWIATGYGLETRLFERLRGKFSDLPLTVEGADWVGSYHMDLPSKFYASPFDKILIRKGNVVLEAKLKFYEDFPDAPTPEEVAAILIAGEN
jgi:hypothetical protein